jgi:hypothetical protein
MKDLKISRQINALKFSRAISRVNDQLKANPSEISSVSIFRDSTPEYGNGEYL